MKIVVPMAGRGSRFAAVADKNPAYQIPKPLIKIKGRPMVVWALDSLKDLYFSPSDLIFICLEEHELKFKVTALLKQNFGNGITVVLIPNVTRGAVETVLCAKPYVDPDEALIVSDSDHFFDGSNLISAIKKNMNNVAGIIPVFSVEDKDPKWSYTLTDRKGVALAVGEKDADLATKGAYANIGAYYFTKSKFFFNIAEEVIARNEMFGAEGKKEFYVAPMYQKMIDKKMKVIVAEIPKVWGLGTPSDLEFFLKDYKK
jgi:NDP-sugar pyrophosphorylase family protein